MDHRLGANGAGEIKRHPFFRGIDWARLYESTPPYRPPITHELDTQNFEQYEDPEERRPGARGSASRTRIVTDPNFIGYTYKPFESVQQQGSAVKTPPNAAGMAYGQGLGVFFYYTFTLSLAFFIFRSCILLSARFLPQ